MAGDVKAVTLTADGTAVAYRTRVKAIYIVDGATAGSLVLKDGGASGTTLLDIATPAGATIVEIIDVPGEGILFSTNVYADVTNLTSVTLFHG